MKECNWHTSESCAKALLAMTTTYSSNRSDVSSIPRLVGLSVIVLSYPVPKMVKFQNQKMYMLFNIHHQRVFRGEEEATVSEVP